MSKQRRDEAVQITDAAAPLSADIRIRQRRYLISMLIRTLCFALAGFLGLAGIVWLAMIFILAAICLPYMAVVMANAATPRAGTPSPFGGSTSRSRLRQLPSRHDLP